MEYVCTIGYSKHENAFDLVAVRHANPNRRKRPKNEFILYRRILIEPALRATLLEALAPELKGQIVELREKAISERGKYVGLQLGFVALCLTGFGLHKSVLLLSKYVGYDWADLIAYLPVFFAFFVIFPVQRVVEHWYLRRYCIHHSHLLETFKDKQGREVTCCKRCGHYIGPSHFASGA